MADVAGPVTLRLARDGEEPEYWGWHDFKEDRWTMVWPSKTQRDMCFPYGPGPEEERGKGGENQPGVGRMTNRLHALTVTLDADYMLFQRQA